MSDIHEGPEVELPPDDGPLPTDEAAPEPTPEPAAEPAQEPAAEPVPTVPLAALNEERHKNRELREAMNQQAAATERVRQEMEDFRKSQTETTGDDEFNKDPLGVLRQDITDLKQAGEQATQAQQAQAQEAQQVQALTSAVTSQVEAFTKTNPD